MTPPTPDSVASPLASPAPLPAPLPVVMTPELAVSPLAAPQALPLSFTIPLRESSPPRDALTSPSWQELLGQR